MSESSTVFVCNIFELMKNVIQSIFLMLGMYVLVGFTETSTQRHKPQFHNLSINEDSVYEDPDVMPQYPGEKGAIDVFLIEHVKYPYDDKMNGEQGLVMAQFVVEVDGSLTQIETVETKKTFGTDAMKAEAIRVVKLMPNWIPGAHKKEAVRVRYQMPFRFAMAGTKKKKKGR